MNIAYASDNNFVDVMLVSIMSFNDHNSDATIYILDCGIKEQKKQKILELCSGKNAVLFVDAKKTLDGLDYELNLDRGSLAAYARLFIGSMLPETVNKALYLDADTMIKGSLKEMYETDISPYIVGGIRDSFSVLNKKVFDISKGGLFINSGVLLIDVDKWRNDRIEDQIYKLFSDKNHIFQGDQGVINYVFHGGCFELPIKYNVLTYLFDFSFEEMMLYRKPDNYFDKEEIKDSISSPIIVHFSSSFVSCRPWKTQNDLAHPFYGEWNSYFEQINGIKRIDEKKHSKNLLLLFFAGFIHAYIRPLIYLIKR